MRNERPMIAGVELKGFLGEFLVQQALREATHPPLPEEFQMLRDTVGARFLYTLGQIHAPIYTVNKGFAIEVKNLDNNVALWRPRYLTSFFATIFDRKLLVMNTWKAIHPDKEEVPKAATFDFVQVADMLTGKSSRVLYPLRQPMTNPGFTGLASEGGSFLRKMQELILSISDDCTVLLVPADKQRERIQKRAFRDHPNIIVQEYEERPPRRNILWG